MAIIPMRQLSNEAFVQGDICPRKLFSRRQCDARCLLGTRKPQKVFLGLNVDLGLVSSRCTLANLT